MTSHFLSLIYSEKKLLPLHHGQNKSLLTWRFNDAEMNSSFGNF
jgi:hypothetical protein